MIYYKNNQEIKKMQRAGQMAARLLNYLGTFVKDGRSTEEINLISEDWIAEHQLISASLNYKGFPKSICTSINHVVCHGIPKTQDVLHEGDIINIDVAVIYDQYYGDTCKTFIVGETDDETRLLVERTKRAMELGIETVTQGAHLNDIGQAIDHYITPFGYGIVRELGGHGVGRHFHESPCVLNYRQKHRGMRLKEGMTFTIEPMINLGKSNIFVDRTDGWTVYTQDFSFSAQFEHTILVKKNGVEIFTLD